MMSTETVLSRHLIFRKSLRLHGSFPYNGSVCLPSLPVAGLRTAVLPRAVLRKEMNMAKRTARKKRNLKKTGNQNTLAEKTEKGTNIYVGSQEAISASPFVFGEPERFPVSPQEKYAFSIMIALGIVGRIMIPRRLYKEELPKIVKKFDEMYPLDGEMKDTRQQILMIIPLLEKEPTDAAGNVSGSEFLRKYAHGYFDGSVSEETFSLILHCLPWLCMAVHTPWGIVAESYNMLSRTNYAVSAKNAQDFDSCLNSWYPTPPYDREAIGYYNEMALEVKAPLFRIPEGALLLNEEDMVPAFEEEENAEEVQNPVEEITEEAAAAEATEETEQ